MLPALFHTIAQLTALATLVVGVYLLTGLPWALVIAGAGVFVYSVLAELGRPLPVPPAGRGGA